MEPTPPRPAEADTSAGEPTTPAIADSAPSDSLDPFASVRLSLGQVDLDPHIDLGQVGDLLSQTASGIAEFGEQVGEQVGDFADDFLSNAEAEAEQKRRDEIQAAIAALHSASGEKPAQPIDDQNYEEAAPFTQDELARIEDMKREVGADLIAQAIAMSDGTLVRHVRGLHKMAPQEIAVRLKETLDWRAEFGIDGLLEVEIENVDHYYKYWPSRLHGSDKYGHMLLTDSLAELNFHKLLDKLTPQEIILCRAQIMELLFAEAQARAPSGCTPASKILYVLDFEKFAVAQISGDANAMLAQLCHYGNVMYTNTVYRIYIVRAPLVFQLAWSVIKQWTHPATKAKIRFTASVEDTTAELREIGVEDSCLPDWLGGLSKGELLWHAVRRVRKGPGVSGRELKTRALKLKKPRAQHKPSVWSVGWQELRPHLAAAWGGLRVLPKLPLWMLVTGAVVGLTALVVAWNAVWSVLRFFQWLFGSLLNVLPILAAAGLAKLVLIEQERAAHRQR